jgi:hypothetical protein
VKVGASPKVACVLLADVATGEQGAELVDAFDITTSGTGTVERVHDLAQQLKGRLPGLVTDVVVVQRADFSGRGGSQQGRLDRLMMEGALVHAARSLNVHTLLRTGRDTGIACGSDKNGAIAEGATFDGARKEAAAAALSGLRRPEI